MFVGYKEKKRLEWEEARGKWEEARNFLAAEKQDGKDPSSEQVEMERELFLSYQACTDRIKGDLTFLYGGEDTYRFFRDLGYDKPNSEKE